MEKVYLLAEHGIYDYLDYVDILKISKDREKIEQEFAKRKVELEEYFEKEYGEDEEVATEVLENKFEIYLDGHAVDDSKTLEIIEREIS